MMGSPENVETSRGTGFGAKPRFALTRLILAWLVTVAVLPLAWARSYVLASWAGQFEWLSLALTAVGLVAVGLFTYGLGRAFPSKRFRLAVGLVVALSWLGAVATLVPMFNGTLLPALTVVCLFLPLTLWVPWAAWMLFSPFRWQTRLGVLAALLLALFL